MSETKHRTILVVEDVDEIGAGMKAALNKRGHEVLRAANAEQAIQMAEANKPAMILTDLELPTFDSMMSLLRNHKDLKGMLVAIIDINSPKVSDGTVNVLADFQALDDLLATTQSTKNK